MHDGEFPHEEMAAAAEEAAAFLRSLSNPSRLMLLCHLVEGDRTVGQLEERLGLSQAYVSQQLARLRADGLVESRRDGRMVHYSLSDENVFPVVRVLYETFCSRNGAAEDSGGKPRTSKGG